jgi:DNA-binding CsgD family transcriptional regulator
MHDVSAWPAASNRRLARALDQLYGEPVDVDGFVPLSAAVLKVLCDADAISFSERDWSRTGRASPLGGFRSIWSEPLADYRAILVNVAAVCEGGPVWTCDPAGGVLRLGDFYSLPRLRDHAVYQEGLRYLGVCFNINFGFTVQGRIDVQYGICRGPPRDFGEAERMLAAAVAPHLRRAYEMAVLRSWRLSAPATAVDHAALALTARQRAVLRWLIEGKSNHVIGALLGISAETVKVHVRRIYHALGVTTRIGAALKVVAAVPGYMPVRGAAEIGWSAGPGAA